MKRLAMAAPAQALLALPVAAQQSPQEQALKARQGIMTFYAMNLGILGAMAKGDQAYDPAAATAAAANIAAVSGTDQSRLWVEGSDDMSRDTTRALPAIWDTPVDVAPKSSALHRAALAMETARAPTWPPCRARCSALARPAGRATRPIADHSRTGAACAALPSV